MDKLKTIKSSKQEEKKDEDQRKMKLDDPVNKASRMVVINNAIGVAVKIPLTVKPIANLAYQIYNQNLNYSSRHPGFEILVKNLWTFDYFA